MREKVIFDANFLYNKKASSFFGNKEELAQFAEVADIIIPEIVIEELESKYSRSFGQEKEKFLKTLLPNLIEHNTNEVVVATKIKEIIDKETISYEVIELKDFNILSEMKKLAVGKLPPFEPSDGTDKGFKDAYIYFTILEYLQTIPDKYVFVCVKDKRFKEALESHSNIYAIESFQEFLNHRISQFQGDYFLEKLEENLGFKVHKNQVKDFWVNGNLNQVVHVENEDQNFVVEVDSGEIVNSASTDEYTSNISELINSANFGKTHSIISDLEKYHSFFTELEIKKILEASFTNDQIRWIIDDEDVLQFIGSLFRSEVLLDNEEASEFLKKKYE